MTTPLLRTSLGLLLAALLANPAPTQEPARLAPRPDRPAPPPPAKFSLPQPQQFTLRNGLRVLVVEDQRAPIFEARVVVRGGWLSEPREAPGVSRLTRDLMRYGTDAMPREAMRRMLDSLGLSYEAGAAPTDAAGLTTTLRLGGLMPEMERGLALLGSLVQRPAFRPGDVAAQKTALVDQMRQNQRDPRSVASARSLALRAGPQLSERANPPENAIERRTAEEVSRFYTAQYRPDNATVVIVAPITADSVRRLAEWHFGGWSGSARRPVRTVQVPHEPSMRFEGVLRPGSEQTTLAVELPLGGASGTDYAALLLTRAALLFRLRERMQAEKLPSPDVVPARVADRGVLLIRIGVPSSSAGRAVEVIRSELMRLATAPPDAAELEPLRRLIAGARLAASEPQIGMAEFLSTAEVSPRGSAYWREFQAALERLSGADLQRIAQREFRPVALTVVAVGDSAGIQNASEAVAATPANRR